MPKKQKKNNKTKFSSFDEVLRTHIEKYDKAKGAGRDNNWWYASELGFCKRKQFFRRLGLKKTDDKEYRIRFVARDGTAMHEWRERAAKEMGVLIASEQRLTNEYYKYKGKFDLIVELNGKPVLIDIKTQRPEAFFRRAKAAPKNRIKEFQKMQLASYVFFARKQYPELREARLYYIDRGGGVREEYVLKFDKRRFQKVTDELDFLNNVWKKQKLPTKEKSWACNYCEYKSICKKVDKAKLTIKDLKQNYGGE